MNPASEAIALLRELHQEVTTLLNDLAHRHITASLRGDIEARCEKYLEGGDEAD